MMHLPNAIGDAAGRRVSVAARPNCVRLRQIPLTRHLVRDARVANVMGRGSARIRRSNEPPVQAVICGSLLHSQRCGERFMNIQHNKQRLLDLEKLRPTGADGCRRPSGRRKGRRVQSCPRNASKPWGCGRLNLDADSPDDLGEIETFCTEKTCRETWRSSCIRVPGRTAIMSSWAARTTRAARIVRDRRGSDDTRRYRR
jgi:hypothetical protein